MRGRDRPFPEWSQASPTPQHPCLIGLPGDVAYWYGSRGILVLVDTLGWDEEGRY